MSSIASYYFYWGKAGKNIKENEIGYHLLPYHSLDVAAVGFRLLDVNKKLCNDLSAFLDISQEQLRILFCFCLALHDLGKFSSAFQNLYEDKTNVLMRKKSRHLYDAKNFRHDRLGYYFWCEYIRYHTNFGVDLSKLPRREKRILISALEILMDCALGHHGSPIIKEVVAECNKYIENENVTAAIAFINDITELFKPDFSWILAKDAAWLERLKQISWNLAGVAVLADWIGSDQNYFKYNDEHVSVNDYWSLALIKAEKSLALLDFHSEFKPAMFHSVEHHFGFKPTPLQNWAEHVSVDDSPQLFILEDVTGAGKTEAALVLTHRLLQAGAADGFYFGLPTMATSNAMFSRVSEHYRAMFAPDAVPSIVLAHGASEMNDLFKTIQLDKDYDKEDLTATAQCHQWFSDSRKKALLATVGVGTLDQVLLAVLPRKHQSLRVFGLHRKVLIFDEAHAADEYMFELLECLLVAHLHQGGSVILLTATLPLKQRQRLCRIWQEGAGVQSASTTCVAFPLATKVSINEESITEQPLVSPKNLCRSISVHFLHSEEQCVQRLVAAANSGLCAVWIRNSVDDALRVYQKIRKILEPKENCFIFHSRFTLQDRKKIEFKVLKFFGKKATSKERKGKILIATQVFQESLDADADVMISDICPIDDLIQRMGRLHRHSRNESGVFQANIKDARSPPEILIHAPKWSEDPGLNWLSTNFKNTQHVYRSPGRLWLGMKKIIELGNKIVMPENARELIEAVYSDDASSGIPQALDNAEQQHFGETRAKIAKANSSLLQWQSGYSLESARAWYEDNSDISTRYSDRETSKVLLVKMYNGCLQPYAGDIPYAVQLSTILLDKHKYVDKMPEIDERIMSSFFQKYPAAKYQKIWLYQEDTQFTYTQENGFSQLNMKE
ncbi:CRISPR-associated helicase Cas3' [Legionella sp. CNM-4043-24]|uniref:CRISPR-associated helicase Cas3' n=1 Tax=Legionella sp. CNM-4043-24 TaxID=3421646 RepID=UPI00403A8851